MIAQKVEGMISVILCGGIGARLWPISREKHPKPFIPVLSGETFLGKAFSRTSVLPDLKKVYTVTNIDLFFKVADTLRNIKFPIETAHILEPFGRNTAPAIAAAAMAGCSIHGEDVTLLVLPADHLILDVCAFSKAVERAQVIAKNDNKLVLFGIKPTEPKTDYGYVQADGEKVIRFLEKPDKNTAKEFLLKQNYFWNSGMFLFKASVILQELKKHAPDVYNAVEECFQKSEFKVNPNIDSLKCMTLNPDLFSRVPNISIDYAVMEKTDNCAMVPCDIGWSDVGTWSALAELSEADDKGNRILNGDEVLFHDSNNTDVYGSKRIVVGIGVKNMLIVDTPDALLVADKSRVNEVKEVVTKLKQEKHPAIELHQTVHTPWGSYTNLETGPRFRTKRLIIRPGAAISLQLHHHRNEHWIVVSGMAEVTCEGKVFYLDCNESTFIKAGLKHRVANKGIIELTLIEVQTGDYLGEDDIVRFEDIYERV